jgi:hypothetical protein
MNENKSLPAKKSLWKVRRREPVEPELRFSPTAWAKLISLRDLGRTEVGGFAISAADDLLFIEDIQMVRQECTSASVIFDDQSVADLFDRQVDAGRKPERFSRIWIHTHPGNSPTPSHTDEETFERVFGQPEWAVMFILARGGQTYARLRFNIGPGGEMIIPVRVDYSRPFPASDLAGWRQEYAENLIDADELGRKAFELNPKRTAVESTALIDPREFADPFFDPLRENRFDEREFLPEGMSYEC